MKQFIIRLAAMAAMTAAIVACDKENLDPAPDQRPERKHRRTYPEERERSRQNPRLRGRDDRSVGEVDLLGRADRLQRFGNADPAPRTDLLRSDRFDIDAHQTRTARRRRGYIVRFLCRYQPHRSGQHHHRDRPARRAGKRHRLLQRHLRKRNHQGHALRRIRNDRNRDGKDRIRHHGRSRDRKARRGKSRGTVHHDRLCSVPSTATAASRSRS